MADFVAVDNLLEHASAKLFVVAAAFIAVESKIAIDHYAVDIRLAKLAILSVYVKTSDKNQ